MNVPTIMHLTKNHIAHLCLFALMIPFLQSCLHEDIDHAKIREIEKQFEMEYIVINDTERDCSMEWFYDSLNGEDSRSQQIKAGEKWVVFGGDRRVPYCAKRIVFSFSGELTLDVQNPDNQYLHIGKNWWDSLPDTSFESKENQATWIYYLSDVLELLSVSE